MDLDGLTAEVDELLADADEASARQFPGSGSERGPIQTLYVPAGDFHADLLRDCARDAERVMLEHAEEFLGVLGGDDALMGRVLDKLATEPVEDLRLDFTTWTGDRVVDRAATGWRTVADAGDLPPFAGIRIPSLAPDTRQRAIRTLARFLDGVGEVPDGFVVTVRSVTGLPQVEALVHLAERLEKDVSGTIRFELQIEDARAVLGPDGTIELARMLHAAQDRLATVTLVPEGFGAARIADHALTLVRAITHDTPVRLADGTTLDVAEDEPVLTVWQRHLDLVRRALARGFVQGRDTHASQLPTRYAATYAFLDGQEPAAG